MSGPNCADGPEPLVQPNILWLCTDHQLLANRPDVASRLPLQSRLGARGMRFDRAYAALPVCSPSRASMLTGLYPHNHGLTENDGRFGGRPGLLPDDIMLNQPLTAAGMRCGWFGKWHLNMELDATHFGFEGYGPADYGYPFGCAEYADYLKRHNLPDPVARIELPGESGTPPGTQINLREQSEWFDYEAGTAILTSPVETHEAYFVADMAEQWLRGLDNDEPFFCRVDTWGPHPPYLVSAPFTEMFANLETAASGNLTHDLMDRPDHHVAYRDYWRETLLPGADDFALLSRRALQQAALCETGLMRLLDVLEELGRLDNTIVIFCADHGDAVASNGGVLNKGGLMVEETLRIPLCMAGPGISQGRSDTPVCNIDLAPTILDLCRTETFPTDGISLRPLLEGAGALSRTGLMTQHYGLAQPLWQRAYHEGNLKLIVQKDGFTELYDLEADPFEMHNLARDPRHADALNRMRGGLAREQALSGDNIAGP